MIYQGIRTSIAMKPYIFVIFHGGGGGSKCGVRHPVTSLDPRMDFVQQSKTV